MPLGPPGPAGGALWPQAASSRAMLRVRAVGVQATGRDAGSQQQSDAEGQGGRSPGYRSRCGVRDERINGLGSSMQHDEFPGKKKALGGAIQREKGFGKRVWN